MANKLICFPFLDGNMLEYVHYELSTSERERVYNNEIVIQPLHPGSDTLVTWKPKEEIELTLHYKGFSRGRSSVLFYWEDQNGHEYPMFIKDVDNLLKQNMGTSTIHAIFTYVKRGCNYGIQFVRKVDT